VIYLDILRLFLNLLAYPFYICVYVCCFFICDDRVLHKSIWYCKRGYRRCFGL